MPEMTRRRALIGTVLAAGFLPRAVKDDERDVLRVRLTRGGPWKSYRPVLPPTRDSVQMVGFACQCVVNADTGEDMSHRVPLAAGVRLWRAWRAKRPVRVWLYLLDKDGRFFRVGDRIAKEAVRIRVVSWEGADA